MDNEIEKRIELIRAKMKPEFEMLSISIIFEVETKPYICVRNCVTGLCWNVAFNEPLIDNLKTLSAALDVFKKV